MRGKGRDSLNDLEEDRFVLLKWPCRGDALITEKVFSRDLESVAEVGTHFFDAEASGVSAVPGGGGATAVGEPKEGGRKVAWVFEGKPEVAIEDGSGPGEGLFFGRGCVDHHDEVVMAGALWVAGEIGGAAGGERDGIEVVEAGSDFKGLSFAVLKIGEGVGKDGSPAEGACSDSSLAFLKMGKVEDGVGAVAEVAVEIGNLVFDKDGMLSGSDGDDFLNRRAGIGGFL